MRSNDDNCMYVNVLHQFGLFSEISSLLTGKYTVVISSLCTLYSSDVNVKALFLSHFLCFVLSSTHFM